VPQQRIKKCSNLSQFETPCSLATPDCPADNQARQLALFFIRDVVQNMKETKSTYLTILIILILSLNLNAQSSMNRNKNSIDYDFKASQKLKEEALANGFRKNDINLFLQKNNDSLFSIYLTNLATDSLKFVRFDRSIFAIQEAINKEGKWQPIEYWTLAACGNSYKYHYIPENETLKAESRIYSGNFKTKIRFKVNINDKVYYTNSLNGNVNADQFQLPSKIRGQELILKIGGEELLKKVLFLDEGSKAEVGRKYKKYNDEMMRKFVEHNKKKNKKKRKK